jgi:hypothetical protein
MPSIHKSFYRLGDFLYSSPDTFSTNEKEFEIVLQVLEEDHETMRSKDLTMSIRIANVLMEKMSAERSVDTKDNEKFKEDFNSLMQSTNEFLTTIGVVSALLLSITIPWILNPMQQSSIVSAIPSLNNIVQRCDVSCTTANSSTAISGDNSEKYNLAMVNLFVLVFMVVSATASMLAIIVAFGLYGTLNVSIVEPLDRLWFLRTNKVTICESYLVVSVASLAVATGFGIYIVYGSVITIVSCVVIGLAMIRYTLFLLKLMSTTHARVLPQIKKQIVDLRKRYNDYQTIYHLTDESSTTMVVSLNYGSGQFVFPQE